MKRFAIMLLLAGLALGGGCKSYERDAEGRTFGQITDDAGIQAVLKTKLIRDPEIKGLAINVEVYKGVVTLYGRVPSEEAKARARELAASVNGVREVDMRLVVVD